jgi:hypothetical protein
VFPSHASVCPAELFPSPPHWTNRGQKEREKKRKEKKRKAKLTKVQIRLGRQHQRLRFDAFHGSAEVPVVGFLL